MIVEKFFKTRYDIVLNRQQQLFADIIYLKNKGLSKNYLLICEHPHTITLGKHAKPENILFGEELLTQRGVKLYKTDRGGDVTYHGPGQLVVYPIFDLDKFNIGLRQYIFNLEEIIIRLLSSYNISACRLEEATGVWIGADKPQSARKICAIGVKSSHFVTMHGLALNVNTDLNYFSLINPCGFIDKGVTSMQKELSCEIDLNLVADKMICLFSEIFGEDLTSCVS